MKTLLSKTKQSVILLILASVFYACSPPHPIPWYELEGTKWRLEAVYFQDGRGRVELEPKDCDTCYTLMFNTDRIAHGISILNTVTVTRGYPTDINVVIAVDEYDEPYDGNLFSELMRSATHISLNSYFLRILVAGGDCASDNVNIIFKQLKP